MESKSLVICDPEENYAQALAFYIMNRKGIHFQVHVCSKLEHIKEPDVLLISDDFSEKERKLLKANKLIILSGGMSDLEDKDVIYKYQDGEQILNCVLELCEEVFHSNELFFSLPNRKKGKIIGIYSPVHRIGKTSYAMKLGKQLSESENVLFISLELYGGVGGHFEKGGQTLADVLYYVRQEKGNLSYILTKAVKHKENLDYLLPVPVSEDVKEIGAQEWIRLLTQILKQSMYETIILDIDEGIRNVYEILRICSQVYLLDEESLYSKAKIEQFEKELSLLGYGDVLAKIERKVETYD